MSPKKFDTLADEWTTDKNGRNNSSPLFLSMVNDIEAVLRNVRLSDDLNMHARTILARLAHIYKLSPPKLSRRDA